MPRYRCDWLFQPYLYAPHMGIGLDRQKPLADAAFACFVRASAGRHDADEWTKLGLQALTFALTDPNQHEDMAFLMSLGYDIERMSWTDKADMRSAEVDNESQ